MSILPDKRENRIILIMAVIAAIAIPSFSKFREAKQASPAISAENKQALQTAAPLALSQPERDSLIKIAVDLKESILHQDIDVFLRHVSKSSGLTCTDTQIPYEQVEKDLHNKTSHLYISLFDSAIFSRQCGHQYPAEYPAISDKEFFTKAKNASIEITRATDGWAQITYKSTIKGHYPREYTFQKEGLMWKLTEGVIVGSCSCG